MANNSSLSSNTNSTEFIPRSGYDLGVYGLDNGQFYYIHVPAIVCILASFTCVVTAIVLSFKLKGARNFFTSWSKSDRFIVYLAICDALYNVFHFTDHVHIMIVKDHVYPRELCETYGFTLVVSISSQNLMVNVVAINAFMLMYFDRNLNFGNKDWKMLLWTFGLPILGAALSLGFGQLGPNGAFCYFDAVKGLVAKTLFTTVSLLLILFMNIILYVLTWKRIHDQTSGIRRSLGAMPSSMKASHRAARGMSLFVAAFFIQWWSLVLYGVWDLVADSVPQPVFHFVTTFTNLGGVLNLGVFFIIRRGQLREERSNSTKTITRNNSGSRNTTQRSSMQELSPDKSFIK